MLITFNRLNLMKHTLFLLLLILSVCASAVEPRWLVAPAIAPDGLRVAFCYQGVLYVVEASYHGQ